MRATLQAIASQQSGMFSRRQALAAGYTRREVDARTRPDGAWVVVRVGIYCERILLEGLDHDERWLLKDQAALMLAQRQGVLSHDSAARALGIDMLDVEEPATHITLFGERGSRKTAGITRHRDKLPLCVEEAHGLLSTSYARTAIDIGRLHGYLHGLVAVDSVLAKGVPAADFQAELLRMEHHPNIARARAACAASDKGAESVLETLGRELVRELDIGEVETQFAVGLAGGRIVWIDIRVGCHLFECDGLVKLLPTHEGGFAAKRPEEVLRDERRREAEVCAEGLGMSRIYWSDCFGTQRERAKERMRKENDVTVARFGRELPAHLRRFADEHPRQRRTKLWLSEALRRAA